VSSGFQIFRKIAPVLLCIATLGPAAQAREVIRKGDTVIIRCEVRFRQRYNLFLRRGIKAAESAQASAIVIEMNTYGGRLDSAEEITGALNRVTIPTYTLSIRTPDRPVRSSPLPPNIFIWRRSARSAPLRLFSPPDRTCPKRNATKLFLFFRARPQHGQSQRTQSRSRRGVHEQEKEVKIGDRVVHAKGSLLTLNARKPPR